MAETFSTQGLKDLFSYPFRHAGWERKVVILVVLYAAGMVVPVLPWIPAVGYMAAIMRRAAAGAKDPDLPEWDDWGRLFSDGLRVGGAGLLAMLPSILLFTCGFGTYFVSMFGTISASERYGRSAEMPPLMFAGMMVFFATMACGSILSLLIAIPLPAATVHVAYKRSFRALFQVGEWWKIFRANLGGFLIGVGLLWAVSMLLQVLMNFLVWTVILCLVGFIAPLLISPYIMLLGGLLYGRIYNEALENLHASEPFLSEESPAS